MRYRLLTLAIVAGPGVSACSSISAPAAGLSIAASAAAFALPADGGLRVPYTVANHDTEPVRLTGSCDDDPAPVLERRLGRSWTTYGGGICPGIFLIGRVVFAPGAVRESSSRVRVAEPGEYRFVIDTDRGRVASASFAVR